MRQEINAIHNIKIATLIVVHPFMESMAPLSETEFKREGCAYITKNSTDIINMINILKNADLKVNHDRDRAGGPIEGIYLISEDGTETKFLFKQNFPSEDTVQGIFHGTSILANSSLPENLYRWAAKMKTNPRCEDFIGPHRTK